MTTTRFPDPIERKSQRTIRSPAEAAFPDPNGKLVPATILHREVGQHLTFWEHYQLWNR
jgi:hypothetical protein